MIYFLYVILSILLLGAFAALAHYLQVRQHRKRMAAGLADKSDSPEIINPADMECCGQHEVCEKDSLLAAVSKDIEYYNDEELDRFRGRSSDQYTSEEAEEFRDILYTMRNDEVAGWVRSLQLRYIELPDDIKDEVFLIIGERRQTHSADGGQ